MVVKPPFSMSLARADGRDRPEAVGEFEEAVAADVGGSEMRVHVDQPGDERLAGEVDMLDVRAPADGPRIGDRADPAGVVHEDGGALDVAAGLDVEHPVGGDHARRMSRRYRSASEQRRQNS